MKKVLVMAACAVLVTGVAANAADVALNLVDTAGNSSSTAAPGSLTLEVKGTVTPTAGEGGLALFGFDLEAPAGIPLASDQATTTLATFVKDEGLTNPAGFGGTLSGNVLLQIGGGQNTIGYAGTTPSYPTGTVDPSVALTETVLASIVLDTSGLADGVYTIQISNEFANVIDPASQPSAPPYTVSAATMTGGSPIYTLTIQTTGDTDPPLLLGGESFKDHGAALGSLGIAIPTGLQANNRHIVEPRQGSVTELVLTFDEPSGIDPATVIPANFNVCGLNSTPGNPATATLDGTGEIVTLTFADGQIPNGDASASAGDAYVLEITGVADTAANVLTQADLYFAASYGNTKSDGVLNNWKRVNSADRSQIVLNLTLTPTAAQAVQYDVRLQGPQKGKINAQDVSTTVLSFSTTDLDNLVVPACP
jgi:hypothetical protein